MPKMLFAAEVQPAVPPPPVVATISNDHYDGAEVVPDEATFLGVLEEVLSVLDHAPFRCLVMGGVGTLAQSRPRRTRDIDLFVHPDDAAGLLDHFGGRGFRVELVDPTWLHKLWRGGVLIDVIFRSTGDIYLDDAMLQRATSWRLGEHTARVIGPEDLAVVKAVAATEHGPHHWYDALSILKRNDLDWDYLVWRAGRHGPRRVLSLLLYAESNDVAVPDHAVRSLFELLHPVTTADVVVPGSTP